MPLLGRGEKGKGGRNLKYRVIYIAELEAASDGEAIAKMTSGLVPPRPVQIQREIPASWETVSPARVAPFPEPVPLGGNVLPFRLRGPVEDSPFFPGKE